jgi:hypothetical protein
MPPDPRDAEYIDTIVAANLGMIRAVHQGDRLQLIGELNRLLHAIIEHNATLADRQDDEALRRAVIALG